MVHDYRPALNTALVHGVPLPKIEWFRDGKPINLQAEGCPLEGSQKKELLYKVESSAIGTDQMSSKLEICHFNLNDIGKVISLIYL